MLPEPLRSPLLLPLVPGVTEPVTLVAEPAAGRLVEVRLAVLVTLLPATTASVRMTS